MLNANPPKMRLGRIPTSGLYFLVWIHHVPNFFIIMRSIFQAPDVEIALMKKVQT